MQKSSPVKPVERVSNSNEFLKNKNKNNKSFYDIFENSKKEVKNK